jgi:outer membrane receptor protein involved in Fe transport
MKHLFALLFLALPGAVLAQDAYLLSGKITDGTTREPLAGASLLIKNTISGTVTKPDGSFELKTTRKPPFALLVSFVGYKTQEFDVPSTSQPLAIQLSTQNLLVDEVVVSASRVEESILKSPVAIEKLDLRAIQNAAAPSFYDALANVKGVQMLTLGLTFQVPNTRGFNIPNNFRFMQLVDGVDMQAATLGVPLGNAIGPTELDIESVEITPGAASALYGMNAINGMANLQTKSPFRYQGLRFYQKTGVNHVDNRDRSAGILTESAVRYAKAFNDRFAFKINVSYLRGIDWVATNTTDQNPQNLTSANPRFPELSGASNPAADLWNRYGDENNNNVPVTIQYGGKTQTFNVRRTGYLERDLINPVVRNLKADASLFYKLNDRWEASYGYRFGLMDGVFQRGNKIQLRDVTVQSHRFELRSPEAFVRTYVLVENTGHSYNLKPLADNLDLTSSTNANWGSTFQKTLQSAVNGGTDLPTAMIQARAAADAGRVQPGTQAFNDLKNTITGINNWDHASLVPGAPATGGAWLLQKSVTSHTEFQYDLKNRIRFADVLVGGDYRHYFVYPDGNDFVDFSRPLAERTQPGGKYQHYQKVGGFVQATKLLFNDRLKLSGSLRVDYNPEFSAKWNPRIAAVYSAGPHNFRVSYQNGFRFPALFEALSFVNNGNVRRVGGLARVNEGLGYLENSYTLASINNFNSAVNADVANGVVRNTAALNNRNLLQIANLPTMQPERINSTEVGYKSVLFDNKLAIDWEAYYNIYTGFLGQVEVAVPASGLVGSDASVLDMLTRSKQTRYRVYTNARNQYHSYGSTLGLTYQFYKKFTLTGNVNFNDLVANDAPDIFVTSFNTPKWATNVSVGNRELAKNLGFNVMWHWQEHYLWQSPLVIGDVPAYHSVDVQVNRRFPTAGLTAKLGASNVFNNRYIQYAGGPNLGGLYYLALTWEVK